LDFVEQRTQCSDDLLEHLLIELIEQARDQWRKSA